MSSQLIEIIIFAGIAVFAVTRLLNMLGVTDDDDPVRSFGSKSSQIKDVTPRDEGEGAGSNSFLKKLIKMTSGNSAEENPNDIGAKIGIVQQNIPGFTAERFLKGASGCFDIVSKIVRERKMEEDLSTIVDKRFVDKLYSGGFVSMKLEIFKGFKYELCEINFFGNVVFISVLFTFQNQDGEHKEKWTFSRNASQVTSKNWYLSDISNADL